MPIPVKKLQNGFEIPALGLGTWLMGGSKVRDPQNDDAGQIEAIKEAIRNGITHIDTAENYAEGSAERLVGEAIQEFDRNKLFITTKVDKRHLKHDDVIEACKASLERLRTPYVDLYLIHAPNDEIPLQETIQALTELKKEGLIHNIGVSNFTTKRLKEAQSLSEFPIVTNQVYYNLKTREPEADGLLWYCQTNDIILTAYRPIDKGMLLDTTPDVVKEVAQKYKKSPIQIMLNWLTSQKNVITIVKMSQSSHIQENKDAADWYMDPTDIELLRKEFPDQLKHSESLSLR